MKICSLRFLLFGSLLKTLETDRKGKKGLELGRVGSEGKRRGEVENVAFIIYEKTNFSHLGKLFST